MWSLCGRALVISRNILFSQRFLISKYSALFQSINVRGLPDGFSRTGRSSADMKALFFLSLKWKAETEKKSFCLLVYSSAACSSPWLGQVEARSWDVQCRSPAWWRRPSRLSSCLLLCHVYSRGKLKLGARVKTGAEVLCSEAGGPDGVVTAGPHVCPKTLFITS